MDFVPFCGSNHRAARKNSILWHDDDPIPDVVTRAIEILDPLFINNVYVLTDVRVLVDDRFPDNRFLTDPDIRNSQLPVVVEILVIFIEIRTHHHHAFKGDVLSNTAANSND